MITKPYHRALGGVSLDDWFRVLVECNKPLLDGVNIVIGSARGLCALEESGSHCLIRHFEVQNVLAGSDGLLELFSLGNLTGISVNEESLGSTELLDHGLGKKVEVGGKRDKLAALHDGSQVLATLRSRGDFLSEKITRGKMSVAILGNNFVALCSLATAGSTKNPDDGKTRCGQGATVNRLNWSDLSLLWIIFITWLVICK